MSLVLLLPHRGSFGPKAKIFSVAYYDHSILLDPRCAMSFLPSTYSKMGEGEDWWSEVLEILVQHD